MRTTGAAMRLAALLVGTGLLAAACGSSGGGAGTAGSAGGGGSSAAAAGGGASVTVGTASGSGGTYLTDGSGRTVYLWMGDPSGSSACSGPCAGQWPPLTVSGKPAASGSVDAAQLGTIVRSDGAKQVTYDGHPLYRYAGDSGAGSTSGQGSDGFGARWWLVAPSGSAITGAGSAPSASASAPSYNY